LSFIAKNDLFTGKKCDRLNLKFIAEWCTDYLIQEKVIDPVNKQVYIYGFQLFFSTTISIMSILIIAIFTHNFFTAFLFLLIFLPLRMTANGYHAKTYLKCFFLTNTVFLIYLLMVKKFSSLLINPFYFFALILSSMYIYIKAPREHPNHKLTEKNRKNNRLYAHIILGLDLIFISLAFMLNLFQIVHSVCATIFIVTAMMMIKNERI
jgi:accessory gene regulator B